MVLIITTVVIFFLSSSCKTSDQGGMGEKKSTMINPIYNEMAKKINETQTAWRAGSDFLEKKTLNYFKRHGEGDAAYTDLTERDLPLAKPLMLIQEIPKFFDSRTKWPQCPSIGLISDQGECGSCWAIAAASTMSDRLCIETNGSVKFFFSAEDMVTCCTFCSKLKNGCISGNSKRAWRFWIENGVVSGSRNTVPKEGCKPYSDDLKDGIVSKCNPHCTNNKYNVSYEEDKHFGQSAALIRTRNVQEIQNEILLHGPVQSALRVFEDLYLYMEGVYIQTTGNFTGIIHAVKIVGWGEYNGLPYWLVHNSWGEDFGENGYFKIRRGNNECNIERRITIGSGKAKLKTSETKPKDQKNSSVSSSLRKTEGKTRDRTFPVKNSVNSSSNIFGCLNVIISLTILVYLCNTYTEQLLPLFDNT